MSPTELIVDSFAGGGGASLGIEWALGRSPDIAINHDAEAIALHAANHPTSKHYCENVWEVDPVKACTGRPVGLMWLSPDCKHFSKAKGGKPVSKRVRGLAWVAVRWANAVRPRVIVLENVEEFKTWGPLGADGRPSKENKGRTFRLFVRRLEKLGYDVQWRELRACDFGAPTIRKRLFLVARCDGVPIVWPEATHGKGHAHPWRTAAECINWSLPCASIFLTKEQGKAAGVKRPLAEPTLRRIARGVRRYVIEAARPFVVSLTHQGGDRNESIDEPFKTVTGARRGEKALVVPILTEHANASTQRNFAVDEPLRTQCASVKGGHFALVSPTLIQMGYGEHPGQAPRVPGLHKPLGTPVAGGNKFGLVAAFLAKHYTDVVGAPLLDPVPTVTSIDHNALVASSLVKLHGTSTAASVEDPVPTVLAGGTHIAEVRAFLVAYYGNEKEGGSLNDPVRTVTSKERFGLVTVEGADYVIVDIGMRMLAPRELYRAQGFHDGYKIDIPFTNPKTGRTAPLTKTAQVRMCGNSVAPNVAQAIIAAQFGIVAQEAGAA